jgi:predicted phage terminase large subunit-like protein
MNIDANSLLNDALHQQFGGRGTTPAVLPPSETSKPRVEFGEHEPLILDGVEIPTEAAARIRALSPEQLGTFLAERYKAKTDSIFLANEVLGMELQEIHRCLFHNLFPKFQPGKSLASLDPVLKKRMVLWSRDLGKSSSSRVLGTQLVLNYPNIRILLMTGSDALAQRQLAAVKRIFEQPTQKFQELFPEYCWISKQDKKTREWHDVEPDFGNAHEFSIPCRTDRVATEKTFTISTARSVNSGSHFEVLFVDDLLNDSNWQSASAQEKVYEDYRSINPLLEPTGYMILTGTHYPVNDVYKRIQEKAAEAGALSQWKFSIEDCWDFGCRNCPHGQVWHDKNDNVLGGRCIHDGCSCAQFQTNDVKDVVFPQFTKKNGEPWGYTSDYLERIRIDLGQRFYSCQYLNAPEQDGTQIFTQALLGQQTLHQREDLLRLAPPQASQTYIAGDLAYSVASNRDSSVLFAFVKSAGRLFVFDCIFGHWSASERVENILRFIRKHRPTTCFLEENLNSSSLELNLIARAPEFNLAKLPLQWIKASNVKDAKAIRISDLESVLKGQRLFLFAPMPGYDKLEQELLRFPHAPHDDFADCLALAVQAPTQFLREALPMQPESVNSWLRRLHAPRESDDAYGDSGCGSGIVCGG